ncbi:MAG TPA: ABC transporter ATP-binding protein [Candidatus Paceibacterota bacterium]
MNYTLNTDTQKTTTAKALKTLYRLVAHEKKQLVLSTTAIILNSALILLVPFVMGIAIDRYIVPKEYSGLIGIAGILLVLFVGTFITGYFQTSIMGGVAQRMLYTLRNAIFTKLQELPVAFFNQNKSGDLISRINNDTTKLNNFFSQSLIQLVSSVVLMLGTIVFIFIMNWRLALAAILPAVILFIITRAVSPWIKRKNVATLKQSGSLSAEVQQGLDNFKVTVAFNRRDYLRSNFAAANETNFATAVDSGIANNLFTPLYGLFAHIAQLAVLGYGIYLITTGAITIGVLVSFLAYVIQFYNPLRQLAAIWASFQIALAGWDRVNAILMLESDLVMVPDESANAAGSLLEFNNVSFSYPEGKQVLHDISFALQPGKIYALVGPTGGGKTTTASLMSRLFDPTTGTILLEGKDIRSYTPHERTQHIGMLLQEPFLFAGTVGENILYGQSDTYEKEKAEALVKEFGLTELVSKFENGLDTVVGGGGETISLGQRQVIAFMRAVVRHPKLLILDEATANIDTVTEQLLEDILKKLPKETTLVIIAHRLNTIERADEIFFVNGGTITPAGSLDHAVTMIMGNKRTS